MLQKYLEPEVHYVADRGSQNSRQKDFPQESKFKKFGIVQGFVMNHIGKSLKLFIKSSVFWYLNNS